ncbi:uncharacterized protein P884DRAFT_270139 [Thermothelomyces heterothallicus CBS 202.75]|uniref:uncharacterized protein n=1 Tax=Thermothelomyces heterothallicus CBS 202.75 TaxID=1149848 RepID=UPI0037444B83
MDGYILANPLRTCLKISNDAFFRASVSLSGLTLNEELGWTLSSLDLGRGFGSSSWSALHFPRSQALQLAADAVSVVCVSDTHNSQPVLPDGDVLIHAGDLTQSGSLRELQAALDWLRAQLHPVKIVVAGNRDLLLDARCDGRRGTGDNTTMMYARL